MNQGRNEICKCGDCGGKKVKHCFRDKQEAIDLARAKREQERVVAERADDHVISIYERSRYTQLMAAFAVFGGMSLR